MNDQNISQRKNILLLFVRITVVFLFLYKGIILNGNEYLEAYSDLINANSKSSTLKKTKIPQDSVITINDQEKKNENMLFKDLTSNMYK